MKKKINQEAYIDANINADKAFKGDWRSKMKEAKNGYVLPKLATPEDVRNAGKKKKKK